MRFIRQALFPVFLICLAIGSGPVGAAMWQWSTTAGSNSTADPDINWAEGMAPSQVNDSARATMAAVARWRDDTSGLKQDSSGSSTAWTLTTAQGNIGTTPQDGQRLVFRPGTTNGASITLAVDGGTAFPVQTLSGTAVGSGTMIAGIPYEIMFSTGASAWILVGATHICSTGLSVAATGVCTVNLSKVTNSLGGNVLLSNASNYFDGPSVAQGTSGTWFASGTVTVVDSTAANITCKLWDGTTLIASGQIFVSSANAEYVIALSGFLTTPAANIKISCRDDHTSGSIAASTSTNGTPANASTLTAIRIN